MERYRVTKTFGHDLGWSAAFRQWRAQSHCRLIHGYALSIKLEFEAYALNEQRWVIDFGGMKSLKAMFQDTFDHKLIVAADDPHLETFQQLNDADLVDLVVLQNVGCEAFAHYVSKLVRAWLGQRAMDGLDAENRVRLVSVEVREHGANSAVWMNSEESL